MANITLDGLPAKTGTVSDTGIIHFREGGVDKKMTVADFLIRISEEYSSDINTFLAAADKAAGRAALEIARRTTVSNDDYTILATDKVVAQIGTMSAPRAFTLPTAASYPAGEELIIIDQSGTVTDTNKIAVSRVSTDTIDGLTSANIESAYGILRLISDGTSKWKVSNAFTSSTPVVIPAGIISAFAANSPPTDWLECNGAAISRTTYATLFAAIGTTWGSGNGSTTFNIPDFRGEFLRGWDHGKGTDPGRGFGGLQGYILENHSHSFAITNMGDGSSNSINVAHSQAGGVTSVYFTTGGAGGSGNETRPRNIAIMYCIKY